MTEGRKKYLRFAFPILGVLWLWLGWSAAERSDPKAMWSALLAGVVFLAAAVQHEWKIRREKRLSELCEEVGEDSSAGNWRAGDEPQESRVGEVVARSAGSRPAGGRRGLVRLIMTVVRFRALAGWRKALTEKAKLVFGIVLGGFLIVNYTFSLNSIEESPFENSPVDMLFVLMFLFVLVTVLQVAPVARWFARHQGAKFGLSLRRRTALAVGTGLLGLPVVLVLLNEVLALVFAGSGWPRGAEWAFEGMDVVGAVCALVAAGPLGAVIVGGSGRRRWFGVGLGMLLLGAIGASAVEPLWVGEELWAGAAVSFSRLALLLVLLTGAFVLEQRSPDDRGAKTKKRRRLSAAEKPGGERRAAAVEEAPAGIWSRPMFVFALAEARMMLRFRQVRLNLVVSWVMPLLMLFLLRSEELADSGGQFALWTATGIAAFLSVFWLAFFANLLGFTAGGARRLSMSAENALAACMPGKVLGALGLVGSLVFAQTAAMSLVLADRIPPADRATPFLVAAFSLLGLAGGGTMVSIWLPRKPKLHEQRDFYCGVLAMVALLCWWFVQAAIFGGAVVAARLLGGPGLATVTMTVLLLFAAAGCGALVVSLAKGDWLRRRLREWAVTA
jgi:hypothetical protein